MKKTLSANTESLFLRNATAIFLVFLVYFFTAKVFIDIYYHFNTSPALIWPPVGIGVVAVFFGGYRMCVPIFLAQFLAVYLRTPDAYIIAFVVALAYALQAAVFVYLLRRFKFETKFNTVRNVQIFIVLAFFVTAIEPIIATGLQSALDLLKVSPGVNFGRAWTGGVFSVLVIVPFVFTWYQSESEKYVRNKNLELVALFAVLIALVYLLFWTSYPSYLGISVIFFLPALFAWFAIRFPVRWLTLAVILSSTLALTGAILVHPTPTPLNVALLTDQIYLGVIAATFLVFVAIVEERRATQKLLESEFQKSQDADKAKSNFIAILGHELRNPLATIVSSLELLEKYPQTNEALEVIKNAERHTSMIRRILDDLLDTARISQKKFILKKEVVELHILLEQSVDNVTSLMNYYKHSLVVSIPDEKIQMIADPIRIKQILINLLTNAAKYTPQGGKIALAVEKQGNFARITVSDNGIGIAPEKISEIFEPFNQVDMHMGRGAGLGLGLFLCESLVNLHHGNINVTSAGLGCGSTFSVFLPLSVETSMQNTTADELATGNVVSKFRLLIVDDNQSVADTLASLLRHHGQEVKVVYSGKEALETFQKFHPDIILLDLGMPDMNGFDVAREIRIRGWTGKIIALSGYGQQGERTSPRDSGFDYHLIKPVDTLRVLRLFEQLFASSGK